MCKPKTPKLAPMPIPPPPQSTVTEDEAVLRESQRERRRAASRSGRGSTILAGNSTEGMPPTGQNKVLLGT
jgi:hypothetical protein